MFYFLTLNYVGLIGLSLFLGDLVYKHFFVEGGLLNTRREDAFYYPYINCFFLNRENAVCLYGVFDTEFRLLHKVIN